MSFLSALNEQQREAAATLHGPLLIVAGAGSGKTRTLTYRIAHLIETKEALPWQILAVTFTNKAADEMKRRVHTLLSHMSVESEPMIGTFHSICVRILRRHFEKFGRESSFIIYDSTDSESLMKRVIKESGYDDKEVSPRVALHAISLAKNQLQTPEQMAGAATGRVQQTIAELYGLYQDRLTKNNAVDFDDLIGLTVKLFQDFPDVLDHYQERWKFIHVDEYQDTNHSQYVLTNLLGAKYRNLCVIGDSDQSIYRFRGADIQNIMDFEHDYPEAKLIKLEQNYRSTQTILDVADAVISKNTQRKPKKMWTDKQGGDLIEVWHLPTEYDESKRIIQEIGILRQSGVPLNDVVILYRTNAQSRVMEESLLQAGIPYKVIGGVRFYARREVKDVLAYLRLILNPNDEDALLRIINVPSRKIGATTIQKLQAYALSRSLRLSEVLKHIEMVSEITPRAKQALANFSQLVQKWQRDKNEMVVADLIDEVISDVQYKDHLLDGTEEGEMRYENVMELRSVASKYDSLEFGESLRAFLEEVALVSDVDELEQESDLVTLMTLHAVKGLEYPYVFIAGCEENIFPSYRSMAEQDDLEEERRLMYVGVTRAMKKLYLTAAKRRMLFGDLQRNLLSRFISDIPEHLTRSLGVEPMHRMPMQFSRSSASLEPMTTETHVATENPFDDGDRVRHKVYGEGIVVGKQGALITVAFNDKKTGLKKFAAHLAPLRKIDAS